LFRRIGPSIDASEPTHCRASSRVSAPSGVLITIDGDAGQTIRLAGINVAAIDQTDFHLA